MIFFRAGRKNAITLRFDRGQRGGGRAAPQGEGQCGVEGLGMYCTSHRFPRVTMRCTYLPHWKGLFALHPDSTTFFSYKFDQRLALLITSFMFHLIYKNQIIIFGKIQCGSRLNCKFDIFVLYCQNFQFDCWCSNFFDKFLIMQISN